MCLRGACFPANIVEFAIPYFQPNAEELFFAGRGEWALRMLLFRASSSTTIVIQCVDRSSPKEERSPRTPWTLSPPSHYHFQHLKRALLSEVCSILHCSRAYMFAALHARAFLIPGYPVPACIVVSPCVTKRDHDCRELLARHAVRLQVRLLPVSAGICEEENAWFVTGVVSIGRSIESSGCVVGSRASSKVYWRGGRGEEKRLR